MFRLKICRRYRRDFSCYLDGELPALIERKLEAHLIDCGECRSHLARLRAGARMARHVPSFKPAHDRWAELQAALDRDDEVSALHNSPAPLRMEHGRRTDSRILDFGCDIETRASYGADRGFQ
jgi:anti-sigma factor RsiW